MRIKWVNRNSIPGTNPAIQEIWMNFTVIIATDVTFSTLLFITAAYYYSFWIMEEDYWGAWLNSFRNSNFFLIIFISLSIWLWNMVFHRRWAWIGGIEKKDNEFVLTMKVDELELFSGCRN